MKSSTLTGLYVRSCALGFVAAAAFVALLLWFDVARLGTLIGGSDDGLLALFLLWLFNGIVFAGVQFGIAVMALESEPDHKDPRSPQAIPVPVPVRTVERR